MANRLAVQMSDLFFPPLPSLNRVKLLDLPGIPVDESVRGWSGYELVGRPALEKLIAARAADMALDLTRPLLPQLHDCFENGTALQRHNANEIARTFGRRLAWLLLVVKRADPVNFPGRPDWEPRHWAYFAAREQVFLGGGLLAGRVGEAIAAETMAIVAAHTAALAVTRVRHPTALPMLGLARCAPAGQRQILLFDFGQSSLKRAVAHYDDDGRFSELTLLPRQELNLLGHDLAPAELLALMVERLAESWHESQALGYAPAPVGGIALAAHLLAGGEIGPGQTSGYGRLRELGRYLPVILAEVVGERLGRPVSFFCLNDAAAAASFYAGQPATLALALGTGIGTGLVPLTGAYRPVAPGLQVATT